MTLKFAIQLKQIHSQRDRNHQMDKIMRELLQLTNARYLDELSKQVWRNI